ncbi:coiled-coil domain-containing protein 50-like isoform X2 [Centruroides vittatus]|uniref:coiled-coil domain-containing protein 50-like isoform X2 n=1 Tax=Centruroides vittatus TaxID=120091 RepID=UPI0035100772
METVEIRSMTDARNGENSEVQEGRVEQVCEKQFRMPRVCREWLIREDGVLAYKLQTEEIEQHYNYNRHRNRLVRTDMQEAKTVQQIEDEEADLQQKYEQMLLEQQERDDELIAQKLQEQLTKEDIEKQKHVEQEDERLARQLQEKEKHRLERKRLEWELRQVEKARCQQSPTNINRENECSTRNEVETVSKSFAKTQITPPVDLLAKEDKDSDLSDFCLKPPPGLTDDEMKKFQEEQDAELARLLQEQETKRRGPNFKDRQLAIEAQDRELARVLQEQERAKAKKAREKARQKAMLQQQQQQQEMETIEEVSSTSPDLKDGLDHPNLDHRLHQEMDRSFIDDDDEASTSGLPNKAVHNIAMVIDPTYNRQKAQSLGSPQNSLCNTPTSSPNRAVPQCPGDSLINCGVNNGYFECGEEEECEGAVPPYMPIQGQRRTSSLDKAKKKKKEKDGCKTQ